MPAVDFPYTRINPKGKNPANLVQQNLEYYTQKATEQVDTVQTDLDALETRVAALEAAGGGELAFVQTTSTVSITSTSENSPNDLLTLPSVTFDGAMIVVVEFHCAIFNWGGGGVSPNVYVNIWDGSAIKGRIGVAGFGNLNPGTNPDIALPFHGFYRFTPPAASIAYRIRANVTGAAPGQFQAGAGGGSGFTPMWARVSKA